jgi:hypothetical protein
MALAFALVLIAVAAPLSYVIARDPELMKDLYANYLSHRSLAIGRPPSEREFIQVVRLVFLAMAVMMTIIGATFIIHTIWGS